LPHGAKRPKLHEHLTSSRFDLSGLALLICRPALPRSWRTSTCCWCSTIAGTLLKRSPLSHQGFSDARQAHVSWRSATGHCPGCRRWPRRNRLTARVRRGDARSAIDGGWVPL
jgi:hypothetical protein